MIRSEKTPMIPVSDLENLGLSPEVMGEILHFFATPAGVPPDEQIAQLIQQDLGDDGLRKLLEATFDGEKIKYFWAHVTDNDAHLKDRTRAPRMFTGAYDQFWKEKFGIKIF